MRSPSVQGARRSATSGTACRCPYILEPYVEHGEQAQRSNGGLIACFDRQLVRKAGWDCEPRLTQRAAAACRDTSVGR